MLFAFGFPHTNLPTPESPFINLKSGSQNFAAKADIESALITFLVTASGVTFYGVGSTFWGLVARLVLFGVRHVIASRK